MRRPRVYLVIVALVGLPLVALAIAKTHYSRNPTPSLEQQLAAWERSHPSYACSITSHTAKIITVECEEYGSGLITTVGMTVPANPPPSDIGDELSRFLGHSTSLGESP